MSDIKRDIGNRGEDAACRYLEQQGYTILNRNYTVRYGEIDIVAQTDDTIVFVEVKTRRSDRFARACEAVSPQKQRRLIKAAQMWLAETGYDGTTRFDVIEVYPNGTINWIESAFWVS